jgi:hypothetical protein
LLVRLCVPSCGALVQLSLLELELLLLCCSAAVASLHAVKLAIPSAGALCPVIYFLSIVIWNLLKEVSPNRY